MLVYVVIVALLGLIRPAAAKPNPPPYILGRGDIYANDSSVDGHTFVFRKDPNFRRSHNKLIAHSFINLGVGNKLAFCDQFAVRFLTEDFLSWDGKLVDVFPRSSNQIGLVNHRNQIQTLTKLDANPNECFQDIVPDLTRDVTMSWDWFTPNLVLLPNNEAIFGRFYVNVYPYNFYSAIYSTITGELLRSEYIADGNLNSQYTDVKAFDGEQYWVTCNCGNNRELKSSASGITIHANFSINSASASSVSRQVIIPNPVGNTVVLDFFASDTGVFLRELLVAIPAANFTTCRGFTVSADGNKAYLLGGIQVPGKIIASLVTVDLINPKQVTVTPISKEVPYCSDIAMIDDHHLAVWTGYYSRKFHVFSV